jgi:nucleoid-associated protein YgaU
MTLTHTQRAVAGALFLVFVPLLAEAQSLRGSLASVRRMYVQAKREKLYFYETPTGVRNAARKGRLAALPRNGDVTVGPVRYPYVQPQTRTFLLRLGAQYRAACGERLVVTSAARPATRQPANATRNSVHPTGMAVDLRKPKGGCLRWLRSTLLELEGAGLIEATEEYGPPHFHVAVFPTPYERYVAERRRATQLVASKTYRVRRGDTLWDIASEHGTTVDQLTDANDLDDDAIMPGQKLVIPDGR